MILNPSQDAQGLMIYDYYKSKGDGIEMIERDDGYVDGFAGGSEYLSQYEDWPARQKKAIRFAKGRVLDIGCGGGRHSLYLQKKGHEVVGVDISPLAIRVSKLRGLTDARLTPITQLGPRLGKFDTILMLGNNFGLFANPVQARLLLRRFLRMTNPGAMIIAETLDIYKRPILPPHRRYHELNRKRGRMTGQVKIRVRYQDRATPWFDYLLVSPREMREIVDRTGWRVRHLISSKGPPYIGIIEKE
jgi:SAM-dependent methyltransferase